MLASLHTLLLDVHEVPHNRTDPILPDKNQELVVAFFREEESVTGELL